MMVTVDDILMGRVKLTDLSKDERENVKTTVDRVNRFFDGFIWPLKKKVNDGYRRPKDAPPGSATRSTHFKGQAIDLDDDDAGTIWKFIWAHRAKLQEIGLWLKHPCWTHSKASTWIHMQIVAPGSGKRFYVPSSAPNPNPKFWDGKYEADLDQCA